uniref:WDR5-like beta-propeller domain-containing protein n=1 Tax=Tetradesmus obliquus TaxID=3088 RepID=A0A383VEF5_TETOB|eukprot:jgi/Sobl393_1/16503/SZX63897.1
MEHEGGINDVAWNPQGNYLATASDDLTARIWDAETGKCLVTLAGHTNYVFCCSFNPVGHILATGSFDETIRFWDVRSGRCLRELPAHSDPVSSMDFTFDGTVLASCSFDGLVRLWETHNGHCLKTLAIDSGASPLSHVCFSPNGQYMLQASLASKLQLVNFESGKVAKTYSGHKNSKYCSMATFVTTLGPRPCIAAGSEDGSIHFWDVNSRKLVQQLPGRSSSEEPGDGHCAAVLCIAAHPSRPVVASAGHDPDCTVKIWAAEASK